MLSFPLSKLITDKRELVRRLGCEWNRTEHWEKELFDAINPMYAFKQVNATDFEIKALKGCEKAYLLAVTLGHGADRVIRSASLLSAYDGFIADAVASAMCESLCDAVQSLLPLKTKIRVSPGYGDIPLSLQNPILNCLDAKEITLTDSQLMIPTKSITAIAGVINDNNR